MLVPGSFASGAATGLPAIVKHQRAGQALVSFGYVRNRSARTTEDGQPRSRNPSPRPNPDADPQTWKSAWVLSRT